MGIEINNLTYKDIFKEVDLNIPENKLVTITGKSSSGKSLFLKILHRETENYDGIIKINNKTMVKKEEFIPAKAMFYMSQNYYNHFNSLKIIDDIKKITNDKIDNLDFLLCDYKLSSDVLEKSFYELSSSELKKILIICMILSDSKIVVLDDPTLDLDQKSIIKFIKWLKKEKRNRTIIISSTSSEFIFKVSDIIYNIENSKLVKYEDKYEFFNNMAKKVGLEVPKLLQFKKAAEDKGIKLMNQDEVNDVLKDVYRNAK